MIKWQPSVEMIFCATDIVMALENFSGLISIKYDFSQK